MSALFYFWISHASCHCLGGKVRYSDTRGLQCQSWHKGRMETARQRAMCGERAALDQLIIVDDVRSTAGADALEVNLSSWPAVSENLDNMEF